MGISPQQYRIRTGMFSNSKSSSFKSNSSTQVKPQSHKNRGSVLKLSFQLLFCVVLIWQLNSFEDAGLKLHSSHGKFKDNIKSFKPRSYFTVNHNFWAKFTNGNRRTNGIKICHWNAGGGYLSNKRGEIENIAAGYKPHLLGISESSFKKNHNIQDVEIQDYKIFFAKTLENKNLETSRVAAYVHKDIIVKVRNDLMSDKFSSVWLELGKPRQRKILVCIL